MTKKCTICGRVKDEIEFNWRSAKHKKRHAHCKICARKRDKRWAKRNPKKRAAIDHRAKENRKKRDLKGYQRSQRNTKLKANFGITIKQYDAMLLAQGGICAICGQLPDVVICGKIADLHVDHNRETGKVRALLCSYCNTALGGFKHDPTRLRKAAAYLEYHKEM